MTTAVAFDENAIGQSLVLTDGDFTLQTSAVVDAHRMARTIDTAIPGSTTLTTGTSATGEMVSFEGIVQNGSNAGTFVFQFAQATATASQSVIRRAGSYMEYQVA